MKRLLQTVIIPTFGNVVFIAFLCILIGGSVFFAYRERIQFDPASFISEVCKVGVTATLLFWLVEYQRIQTEIGKEKYTAKLLIEGTLLNNLEVILKLLRDSKLSEMSPQQESARTISIKEAWNVFYNVFISQKNQPIPGLDKSMFVTPVDISKINTSYQEMPNKEDVIVVDRKIREIESVIEHLKKFI